MEHTTKERQTRNQALRKNKNTPMLKMQTKLCASRQVRMETKMQTPKISLAQFRIDNQILRV